MCERINYVKEEVDDGVELQEKIEITDVFEQFIDEKGAHERDEYTIKNEESNSDFSVNKENNYQLMSTSFSEEMPRELETPIDMICNEVKLEESGLSDVSEHFIDKGVYKRDVYMKNHKGSTSTTLVAETDAIRLTSASFTKEITKLHSSKSYSESIKHKCDNSQMDEDGENNLGKNIESDDFKGYKCTLCEYTTIKRAHLKQHVESVHLNIKKHKCHLCEYASYGKQTLQRHVKSVHSNIKKYKCHLCHYAANQKVTLDVHVKSVHFNIKEHKCHLCDYDAITKSDLQRHINSVHLNIREYKCHLCDYASSVRRDLQGHVNFVHLNIKEHKCYLCEYATSRKSNLQRHINSVHANIKA